MAILSLAGLLASVVLLQLSAGALGPLDALSGAAADFTTAEIGLLGSGHFMGFFVGCWGAPRLMGRVGHVRTFTAFATIGAIGVLAHPLVIDPLAWTGLRVLSGLSVAGCYTVVEAWLHARLTNETRGRAMGTYRVVDLAASVAAQLMIGVLDPLAYASYAILAMLSCACLLPITVATTPQPETPKAPRLRPLKAIRLSPLAAVAVLVSGVTIPSFRFIGPVFGLEVGLSAQEIGVFLAAILLGGALAQIPIGWLADRIDRRRILLILSAGSIAAMGTMALAIPQGPGALYAASLLFGLTAFPIFSVATAHANDFCPDDFVIELAAAHLFIYAAGAVAAPYAVSRLIEAFGPGALLAVLSGAHAMLILVSLARMLTRRTALKRTAYAYTPRTSFLIGRLLRRKL